MNKKVFKYPLRIDDKIILSLPKGAEILTVQTQFEHPCLWALVDPYATVETRVFRLAGTGHPIAFDIGSVYKYINSFQLQGGNLIFHLFEIMGA